MKFQLAKLVVTILINGHSHELIREMPNIEICKTAMEHLEPLPEVSSLVCEYKESANDH